MSRLKDGGPERTGAAALPLAPATADSLALKSASSRPSSLLMRYDSQALEASPSGGDRRATKCWYGSGSAKMESLEPWRQRCRLKTSPLRLTIASLLLNASMQQPLNGHSAFSALPNYILRLPCLERALDELHVTVRLAGAGQRAAVVECHQLGVGRTALADGRACVLLQQSIGQRQRGWWRRQLLRRELCEEVQLELCLWNWDSRQLTHPS
jgi:hypothetical protein